MARRYGYFETRTLLQYAIRAALYSSRMSPSKTRLILDGDSLNGTERSQASCYETSWCVLQPRMYCWEHCLIPRYGVMQMARIVSDISFLICAKNCLLLWKTPPLLLTLRTHVWPGVPMQANDLCTLWHMEKIPAHAIVYRGLAGLFSAAKYNWASTSDNIVSYF